MKSLATILQSFDQAETAPELDKAVESLLNNMTANVVQADIVEDNDDEDMRQGSISNKPRDEKMVSSNHVRSLLVELLLMHRKFVSLQKAYKAVQSYVDQDTTKILTAATMWITSQSDALRAERVYNSAWFSTLPLSIDAKIEIAQSLSDTCSKYGIKNGFWSKLAAYNDGAVEFSAYKGI